jgi:excisionase family DNA binding protein
MSDIEELLTTEEAIKILKIHPKTIRLWLREGKIKGVKIGKEWRIAKSSLLEFIQQKDRL